MKINILVQNYLNTRDEALFKELTDIFSPLIQCYARKLYYLEHEDCVQELTLALFESLLTIKDLDKPGMCFSYIQTAIYHRFCKLYYESKSVKDETDKKIPVENLDSYSRHNNDFDDSLFLLDLMQKLEKMEPKNRQIIIMLCNGWSDKEIAEYQGCSKQYINRIKKKLLRK